MTGHIDDDPLEQMLLGRAQFLEDMAQVKTPELLRQAATYIKTQEEAARHAMIRIQELEAALATPANSRATSGDDETYEIGFRDGYEQAVQDIDRETGGDGEYRYCTDHDPDFHTPDAATMKQRIKDRFETLNLISQVEDEPASANSRAEAVGAFKAFYRGLEKAPADMPITAGSSMAKRQLTVGDLRALLQQEGK